MGIIDFKATKCKHCYKCVRYCDVKAIMIKDERAEIMPGQVCRPLPRRFWLGLLSHIVIFLSSIEGLN